MRKAQQQALVAKLAGIKHEQHSMADRMAMAKKRLVKELSPSQLKAYKSNSKYILCDGERGSGKTTVALHKMVERMIEEFNNQGLIIVRERRQGSIGGAWHKIQTEILPRWEAWMELDHDDPEQRLYEDSQRTTNQDDFLWVRNVHGGHSQIMMISMPHAEQVEARIKGPEPGFVVVDEAQTMDGDEYFQHVVQQVGRRPHVKGRQQTYYCANPDGPSHWLYKRFFELPFDPETRVWNEDYARFHIPVSDNAKNLPTGYIQNIMEATRSDKILYKRMVEGIWIDRPTGAGIFVDHWAEEKFVVGSEAESTGIVPVVGHPVIMSYDLGSAHSSITMEQLVPVKGEMVKLILDEFDYVGKYASYLVIVPHLIRRMVYWEEKVGTAIDWIHISDNSAFNQYRAATGSYDCADVLKISKEFVERMKLPERFIIRMKECPKGQGSIAARVRMMSDAMFTGKLLVSATCQLTRQMFSDLEEDPKDPTKPKETGPLPHRFDSSTYGFFFYEKGKGASEVPGQDVKNQNQVYSCPL